MIIMELNLMNIKEILYFVVDKNYQRREIGTRLLNLCIENEECDIIYEAGAIMENMLIRSLF
jgi:GNAT superfamily N-acetyltransferase